MLPSPFRRPQLSSYALLWLYSIYSAKPRACLIKKPGCIDSARRCHAAVASRACQPAQLTNIPGFSSTSSSVTQCQQCPRLIYQKAASHRSFPVHTRAREQACATVSRTSPTPSSDGAGPSGECVLAAATVRKHTVECQAQARKTAIHASCIWVSSLATRKPPTTTTPEHM